MTGFCSSTQSLFGAVSGTTLIVQFTGIHHVGIVVSDLERSLDWYRTVLEFELRARTIVPDTGLEFAYVSRDGIELELFMQLGSKPASADARGVFSSFHQQGIPHFALGVASVDAAYEWAVGKGLDVILAPQVNETMGVRYLFIADPDGTQIEFLERLI